jgi:hypothetical protein
VIDALAGQRQQGGRGRRVGPSRRGQQGVLGQLLQDLLAEGTPFDVRFHGGTLGRSQILGQQALKLLRERTGVYRHLSRRLRVMDQGRVEGRFRSNSREISSFGREAASRPSTEVLPWAQPC